MRNPKTGHRLQADLDSLQEFPPDGDWLSDIHVRVDLGYQGMQSDYNIDQIDIPHKKPRKSKKNPTPELSAAQKAVNKVLSQVRIFVEHAIGGMKRYNILVHAFRNRKENFEDDCNFTRLAAVIFSE